MDGRAWLIKYCLLALEDAAVKCRELGFIGEADRIETIMEAVKVAGEK